MRLASHGCVAVNQKGKRRQSKLLAPVPSPCSPLAVHNLLQKKACGMLTECNGAHSHLARAIHLYVCVPLLSSLYQSVLRSMPFLTVYFWMMRLEPSAPLNLLTYTVLYLSLTHASCYCTLTLDQINEVSQYFWLFVSFLKLVDDITNLTDWWCLLAIFLRPCGITVSHVYDLVWKGHLPTEAMQSYIRWWNVWNSDFFLYFCHVKSLQCHC